MAEYHCASCGASLPTPPGEPCSECGSTDRSATVKIGQAIEVNVAMPIAVKMRKAVARGYMLVLLEPTESSGSWSVMLHDSDGNVLYGGEGDRDNAIEKAFDWLVDHLE